MAASQLDGKLPYPDNDKGPELLHTLWVLSGISMVVVALRIYTKLRKTRRLYWDDGLMVLALSFGIVYAATTTVAIHYGLGRHYLYLGQNDRNQSLRWGVLTIAWGTLSPMTGRISFCVTLLFLTSTDPRVKRWPIWFFIVMQVLVNVGAVIAFYAQCGSNIDIYWTPSKQAMMSQYCWDPTVQTKLGYSAGSFNCVTDAFLTILPAVLIEHTKLSLKKKFGVACLLCLSIVALVASVVKTYAVKSLSEVADYTYDLAYYVIWMSVELNVVITVASIPLIRPLFRREAPAFLESETSTKPWDSMTLHSAVSAKGSRTRAIALSLSSQENIMPHMSNNYEMEDTHGITVTTEVSVSYESTNTPFVHAALVGLVQGEITNPQLARRARHAGRGG